MKVKLLKKLRREANSQVTVYSITKTNGEITGMRYGMSDNIYSGLFSWGDTEETFIKKVSKIFFEKNIIYIREKYKKYSRKYHTIKNN